MHWYNNWVFSIREGANSADVNMLCSERFEDANYAIVHTIILIVTR